jgi:imidazole glycerol-phosphate synthase subunit HisH
MKTLLIDYGSGNLRSCAKSLEAAGFAANGHELVVSSDPTMARDADALVLPGQGHFRQVMESFLESGFEQVVRDHIAAGKAFLGICVGMQILFDRSEESSLPGLGVIPGEIKRFPKPAENTNLEGSGLEKPGFQKPGLEKLSVPQMQWNTLEPVGDSPLMRGLGSSPFAYFVHSYYAPIGVAQHGARTNYGLDFLSVVSRGNVHATQFHPEKSQRVGLKILENFRNWAAEHKA